MTKSASAVVVQQISRPQIAARRVGLIIPPSPFLLDERVFVSLGILKVASALRQQGSTVSLLDLSGVANYLDALDSYLSETDDEVIGITATTPQFPAVVKIVERIRNRAPQKRVILGGPHVTLSYAALKYAQKKGTAGISRAAGAVARLEEMFDVLVPGDGELAVLAAVQPDSPKVIDGDDRQGAYFMADDVYEEAPLPARNLVDLDSYKYSIEGFPATSLIAQLGCPFACAFCGGRFSNALRVIRMRSTESILQEVEMLHLTYGYTGFMFYDDELNVSRTMVELMNGLADLQEKLGVSFRLRGFIKSELFTEEQAIAMHRAGFRWLLCGFEAASERILTNIEKRATIDDNTRAVEIAKRNGLKVKGLMSIGHAGETAESALTIRDWLVDMAIDDFDCTIITTYPGTPYYDLALPHESMSGIWTYTHPKSGDRLHSVDVDFSETAEYYKGDPDGGYSAFIFTDALSSDEIVSLRDTIESDVRDKLGIPFNPGRPGLRFEHSMGQGLPASMFRRVKAPV